jgi:hypothetical protein
MTSGHSDLNTQGLTVGKSSLVLKVKERDKVIEEVRIQELCQVNLFGGIQITTQAIQHSANRKCQSPTSPKAVGFTESHTGWA